MFHLRAGIKVEKPMTSADSELPRAYGTSPLTATLRSVPEDFCVEEILGYEPDGEGEHAFLWVE
jgi:tRNA pseudouridine13 synthase